MKDRLSHYVRTYDGDLPADICRGLISGFKQNIAAQYANGRGVHPGLDASRWTELDVGQLADRAFLGYFLNRMETALARYNAEVGLDIAIPFRPKTAKLVMKRYAAGGNEGFQTHFDAVDAVANRYLVFLWYLNDIADGGETAFPGIGLKIRPKTGRLVMFPPYWMFQHAGLPPRSDDKYILSTYLLF